MVADDGADLRLYRLVHRAFRQTGKEIAEAMPNLVDADQEKLARIADIWDFYSRALRMHHVHEDDEIWPVLVQRRPDFAETEAEMKREHEEVDEKLDPADAAAATLRSATDAKTVAVATQTFAACVRKLDEHLDHEEGVAFPFVRDAFGREEFAKLEEQFLRSTPNADLPYAAATLDELARQTPDAERPPPPPLPVRLMLALSWRRKYRKFVAPLRDLD
jgi:hemerythrin-like domain-containing protein